jgi:tRNA (uracil-5-)-methyltransferase TRM9
MNSQTAGRLINLNKQFYQTFGREFSSTRQRLQPGVRRILDGLVGDESILDLGCGNGELGRELVRHGHRGQYLGVDFSLPMLKVARIGQGATQVSFIQANLASPGWAEEVKTSFAQPFDVVTAFAVLHHIPGQEMRLDILNKVHDLLQPGGRFIHSEWQFLNSERLRRRIQPWEEAGLLPENVDEGDYLLDWRSGGHGVRYVHFFNEAELDVLAMKSRYQVRMTFYSDGFNEHLGIYQAWEAISSGESG